MGQRRNERVASRACRGPRGPACGLSDARLPCGERERLSLSGFVVPRAVDDSVGEVTFVGPVIAVNVILRGHGHVVRRRGASGSLISVDVVPTSVQYDRVVDAPIPWLRRRSTAATRSGVAGRHGPRRRVCTWARWSRAANERVRADSMVESLSAIPARGRGWLVPSSA